MIAFYITSHGFGHAARSLEIISSLILHDSVTVVSEVPEAFLRERLGSRIQIRRRAFDVGMVQRDSLRGDEAATLIEIRKLMAASPRLLDEEVEWLRASGACMVIVDSPALPLQAAARVGIPGIAVASFGWDYIYSMFKEDREEWDEVCRWLRRGYASATHLLRYPLSEPMEVFSSQEDVPLVARPGTARRQELAQAVGADPALPWALVWFHELDLEPGALELMEKLPYVIFTVAPMRWRGANFRSAPPGFLFSDVLATVDVVLSKPGFGVISDCVANDKPLVYVPRDDFRESILLEAAIQRYLRSARISAPALYRGQIEESLRLALTGAPATATLPFAGGPYIAERLISLLSG